MANVLKYRARIIRLADHMLPNPLGAICTAWYSQGKYLDRSDCEHQLKLLTSSEFSG